MNQIRIKRLQDKISDLTLKIVMKNLVIAAQQLQIKALKQKLIQDTKAQSVK